MSNEIDRLFQIRQEIKALQAEQGLIHQKILSGEISSKGEFHQVSVRRLIRFSK